MAKIKNIEIPNDGEDVEELNYSYIAIGNVKWYSHSGKILAFSLKIKHTTTICPSEHTPRHLSQRNEKLCSHKILYTNVYSKFV